MFRFTVLYKNTENGNFDFDYYINKHLPLSRKLLKDFGLIGIETEKGLSPVDGQCADYICISHVNFSSLDGLKRAMNLTAEELKSDIVNYTNIEPQVQISEVLLKS